MATHETNGRSSYWRLATLGILVYMLLVLAPLLLMVAPPLDPGRSFVLETSVAAAFVAAGVLGMQFVLAARFAPLKQPYGVDAVYYFHRQMALVSLGLVAAHPILLLVDDPERLGLLNVLSAPWSATVGVLAALAVAGIVGASLLRRRLPVPYELWHGMHATGAVAILALVTVHIANTGIYTIDWKLGAFLLYPALAAVSIAYNRVAKPLLKRGRPYRLERIGQETPDIWTLTLRPDGHPGIRFRPGQHAWYTIGRSPFSLEEHPFSFSSSAEVEHGGFEITVKELGDFTKQIGETPVGTTVYVDGPFGAFTTDRHRAPHYVFITGGVGITPVMSILRTAADRSDRTPMTLVYGAKSLPDLAFAEEIGALSERLDLSVTYVLENPPAEWEGEAGFITREIVEKAVGDAPDAEYFACGPPAMTEVVQGILDEMGIDQRRFHAERFDLA